MNGTTGLLFFDNDPKITPADKIRRAAAYYQEKHGTPPSLAFVNLMWSGTAVDGIEVKAIRSVPPNNIWIGVNENGKT